ncbi:MAG TPA: energy transducer TonB [Steroidobacteraceae bacterium]|nr:energy transducer TonB [Steroidobacteraceae bacterium]
MAAYATDSSFVSRRAIVFLAIVSFHVLIVWGLASGLARQVVELIAPPIETDIIEELEQREEPPPPPPPEMERPPVEVPPPEVSIDIPVESSTAIQDVTDRPPPPRPPPPRVVQRTAPKLDVRRSPSTDDYYPPASRRSNEEGVTTVRACVSRDGRTSGTPSIEKTSGHTRLDEAAVKWAQRARWTPGTEDGKPVEQCSQFNVRFKLTD